MKPTMVTIGGVQLRLAFDLQAWFDVEDEFGSMEEMRASLVEGKRPVQACMALLAIEANCGQRLTKETAHYTKDWMKENVQPWQVTELTKAAYETLSRGLKREDEQESEDVDVVAAEIAKKNQADA